MPGPFLKVGESALLNLALPVTVLERADPCLELGNLFVDQFESPPHRFSGLGLSGKSELQPGKTFAQLCLGVVLLGLPVREHGSEEASESQPDPSWEPVLSLCRVDVEFRPRALEVSLEWIEDLNRTVGGTDRAAGDLDRFLIVTHGFPFIESCRSRFSTARWNR